MLATCRLKLNQFFAIGLVGLIGACGNSPTSSNSRIGDEEIPNSSLVVNPIRIDEPTSVWAPTIIESLWVTTDDPLGNWESNCSLVGLGDDETQNMLRSVAYDWFLSYTPYTEIMIEADNYCRGSVCLDNPELDPRSCFRACHDCLRVFVRDAFHWDLYSSD